VKESFVIAVLSKIALQPQSIIISPVVGYWRLSVVHAAEWAVHVQLVKLAFIAPCLAVAWLQIYVIVVETRALSVALRMTVQPFQ
jgi:hypothetical protein